MSSNRDSHPEIRPPETFAQRHAGSIIGAVCFALLGIVIAAQVGC
ncbi:hypothetical protein BH11MYX3_BH11MYX3_31300 [soil metagenome]